MERRTMTEAIDRHGYAASLTAALVAMAMLLGAAGAVGADYSGAVVVSPSGNHPGDANQPDAGNVVSGGDSAVVVGPRASYDPAYSGDTAYPAGTVVTPGGVVAAPPYDGGYANVPDSGNVVNGPHWGTR